MKDILEGWASAYPEQAIEWFYNLSYDEGEVTQKMVANYLLDAVAKEDTSLASEVLIKYLSDVKQSSWIPVSSVMKNVWEKAQQSGNSEYAKSWALSLPEGKLKKLCHISNCRQSCSN